MYLYHFSEESDIKRFVPKEKQNIQGMPPLVWAIDQEHEVSYYFPRDCPRIVLRKTAATTDAQARNLFAGTTATTIITVESRWYTAIKNTSLYRYVFPRQGFELFDRTAGYYTSPRTLEPLRVEAMDHLVDRILATGAELRFTDNLYPLRDSILTSGYPNFGIHRFANARAKVE
ncbi:DUF6886 family protein [Paenibacillus sp. NPDC058177]|uniref:DUF6886 family protein n=1 Tax=Paenibacillus sp. NPDC058177 TaxID=3346369 RepID=UPI0036DC7483